VLKPGFIDLSHHNSIPSSLQAAADAGIVGVIHKCTEGTTHVDDKADARWYLAKEAGLMWGLYHFVRPGSMEAQVDFFLENAAEISDENTLLALDWEDTGVSLDDAVEFMALVEQRTGRAPVLYSGHVLKEALGGSADPRLSQYRLWLAQYASAPTLPPGWDQYWGWQYTDQGSVPGITPPTDVNAYPGSADGLIASWSGAGEDVEPGPEPEPEGIEILVIVPPGVDVKVITRKP
jgi:GH25 family lysozyme M1 (1,4-beta-N-acetylmuramidase)